MRRVHKKSRYGCHECKKRRIKCDEARPSCSGCSTSGRRCPFLDAAATLPSPTPSGPPSSAYHVSNHSEAADSPAQAPSPMPEPSLSPTSEPAAPGAPTAPSAQNYLLSSRPPPSPRPQSGDECYSLLHLELLHHFQSELSVIITSSQPNAGRMMQLAVSEAFSKPYLMDELLALAAAHKSCLSSSTSPDIHNATFYRTEATRLQTRGLAHFNAAQAELSDDNCVAIFFYSAMLGHHMLFNTFSPLPDRITGSHRDLSTLLDNFVQCLSLHRGIRVIASESWQSLQTHIQARLTAMNGAVKALQSRFDVARVQQSEIPIQDWPVRVPTEYISLLKQRQPEALVILAYYAVLLHHARNYWAVGSTGEFLIRSITEHLGSYWAEWLAWPNEVLSSTTGSGV
ncbi:Upc2 protein [Lasiosphaeria ovina]|uniref:Upc2 protein n=1 Tax=Lasiosphaeria ovina TaxID=92902 RepID=A0AAE0MYJ0_9PEZI|nr:Upc2 protein [Lasiosphaeria ovina]